MSTNTPHSYKTASADPSFCPKCHRGIFEANSAFQCAICPRRVHVDCDDHKYNDNEVKKLRANSSFKYICFYCNAKFKTGDIRKALTSQSEQINEFIFKNYRVTYS